jgi:hypothetical protein
VVEQRTHKPLVAGSIPASGTIETPALRRPPRPARRTPHTETAPASQACRSSPSKRFTIASHVIVCAVARAS